ncbi:uncharacterized protein LOC111050180 [Nilaparvata lugens]|uniref:uncharacterized protein LOC111050180 n=1 Tax=Nilaparvata lugens TaxID=108931 RepID=UPI00193DF3D1|nr:uncharacterized protein LOC111050180 [Nilaparvata lugens]
MLQRRPGVILQLLLAGGSYKDRKFKSGELSMIGAMPAVAVRHERRRQEKRTKRPSLLYLQSPPSRSPTPSPLQSPPALSGHCAGGQGPPPEVYVCGKVSVLHIVVVSLLLGAVLLIVGLVQLKPRADASQHRFVLLGSGAFLMLFGIVLAIVRCCVLPWAIRKRHQRHHAAAATAAASKDTADVINGKLATAHARQHHESGVAGSGTPRASLTSQQQRPSNATVLSPTEQETLISKAATVHHQAHVET